MDERFFRQLRTHASVAEVNKSLAADNSIEHSVLKTLIEDDGQGQDGGGKKKKEERENY
jgi:hypothetical protein